MINLTIPLFRDGSSISYGT